MRARRLAYGLETVRAAALSGRVCLLLTASDLSAKTAKEVDYLSRTRRIPLLPLELNMDGVARTIGRRTGVIGITDPGFGTKLMQTYHETEEKLCRENIAYMKSPRT